MKNKIGLVFVFLFAIGIIALLTACATTPKKPPVQLKEGMPNTLTYPDEAGVKKTVYDLNGLWEADYMGENVNKMQEVRFNQEKNAFLGIKTIGDQYVGAGQETIKGTLQYNGFKNLKVYHSADGWRSARGKITNNGNRFVINGFQIKINLKRK